MRPVTKAEEQIMKIVWEKKGGLLIELVESMPAPQLHKNTVATVLKTLVTKGFVKI